MDIKLKDNNKLKLAPFTQLIEKITTLYHNNCPNIDGYSTLKSIINYSKNNQPVIKYNLYKDSPLWNSIKTTYPSLIPYTDACHDMLSDICTCITPGPMQLASSCNDIIQQGVVDCYLESTGSQYIDTGFKPQAGDEFEVTYMITGTTGTYNTVFGTRVSTTSNAFMFGYMNGGSYIELGSSNIGSFNKGYTQNVKHTIKLEGGKLYVDDVYDRDITVNQNTIHNLLLFTLNSNGSPAEYGRCRIYSFTIKRNDVKVLNLIPAYNGNVATMKDLVSDTFLTPSGSGNFTLGGTIIEEGENITDYVPDCTYDETPIILLNRVRVDIGNVSGSLSELMQFSTLAGFNDNYEPQTKPRLVGTWTVNDWYTPEQLAEAQAAFDGLTIVGDPNYIIDFSQLAVQTLDDTQPNYNPGMAIVLQAAGYGVTFDEPQINGQTGRWMLTKTDAANISTVLLFKGKASVVDNNKIVSNQQQTYSQTLLNFEFFGITLINDWLLERTNFNCPMILPNCLVTLNQAFYASNFTYIHILATTPPTGAITQYTFSNSYKIYVGDGSSAVHDDAILAYYVAATGWSSYSSRLDTWYNYLHPTT